ncbi:MAG: hypothetical protein M1275_02760 [Patescibacteria group bacterium]|nr:hypothetical protein [Patescibacteria group bacterium]
MSKPTLSFFLSAIFAAFLIFASSSGRTLAYYLLGFAVLCALLDYFLYRRQLTSFSGLTFLLYGVLWIAASFGFMALASGAFWRVVFALLLAFGFWRLHWELQPFGYSHVLDNLFFISVFGIYLSVWAANFYFTPAWWLVMCAVFVCSWLFFWTGLHSAEAPFRSKILYCLLLAFVLTELAWAMLFLPVHFLPAAIVFSVVFYCLWMLSRFHLQKNLSREKIIFYTAFGAAVVIVTLIATAWTPKL